MEKSDHIPSVIMVDDEENSLESMSRIFRHKGYRVETCLSAPEALAAAGKNDFDVALLDINMPGMNGVDLHGYMKELRPEMEVLYVTGHENPDHAVTAANQKVAGYVLKPVDPDVLLERVRAIIDEQQQNREMKRLREEVKTANAELSQLNSELEEKVKKRTAQLEEKNNELSREVAQRKEAEEKLLISEALLSSIIENAPDAVITFDGAGNIEHYNRAAQSLFLYSRQEVKSKGIHELAPRVMDLKNITKPVNFRYVKKSGPERWTGEIEGVRKNGERFSLYCAVSRARKDDGEVLFTGVMQDITEQMMAKRRLEKALKETQDANADKITMVGSIAHEVANPVTTIINLGSLTEKHVETLPAEKLRHFMKGIIQGGNRIQDFMEELKTFSRLQAGDKPYQIEEGDFVGLINSIVKVFFGFEEVFTGKRVRFDNCMERSNLPFDKKYIGHVLRNLIGNALKYSQQGEEVIVRAETIIRDENGQSVRRAKVSVIDRGNGVHEDEKEIIFNRYHQGRLIDSKKRSGTGIGLSLARDIIREHGGDIWCEDNPLGKGAVFSFTLPMVGQHKDAVTPRHLSLDPAKKISGPGCGI